MKYSSLIILLIISGCATNPVSGIPDFVTITEQQEISIGASYHKQILEENNILKDKNTINETIKLSNYSPGLCYEISSFHGVKLYQELLDKRIKS